MSLFFGTWEGGGGWGKERQSREWGNFPCLIVGGWGRGSSPLSQDPLSPRIDRFIVFCLPYAIIIIFIISRFMLFAFTL